MCPEKRPFRRSQNHGGQREMPETVDTLQSALGTREAVEEGCIV
jgi:hypothetical protein